MGAKGKTAAETPEKVKAFEAWYSDPKRSFEATRRILLSLDPPIDISSITLLRWAKRYGWMERANERDAEIARQVREDAIKKKKDFLERQANVGRLLQKKGVAFLQDDQLDPKNPDKGKGGIKSDYAAIQAIRTGLDLEKVGMEMPDQQSVVKQEVVFRVVRKKREKPNSTEKQVDDIE